MRKAIALVLVVAGVLALVYRGFSYRGERHEAKLGPLAIQVDEKKRVEIPVWAGVAGSGRTTGRWSRARRSSAGRRTRRGGFAPARAHARSSSRPPRRPARRAPGQGGRT